MAPLLILAQLTVKNHADITHEQAPFGRDAYLLRVHFEHAERFHFTQLCQLGRKVLIEIDPIANRQRSLVEREAAHQRTVTARHLRS